MVSTSEMKTVQEKIKKVKSLVKIVKAKGANTSGIEKKIENATVSMMRDDLEKAVKLSEEAMEEIEKLKAEIDANQKSQKKGLGRGLGALLGKDGPKPAKEEKQEEKKEEPAKEEPPGEEKKDPSAKRKEEIKLIIDDWKSQGFNTSTIDKDFDSDIAKLEESFIVFSEKITKLEDLTDEFEKIKKDDAELLSHVQNSVDEIEKSLKDPEMAEAVEKLLKDIPHMLEDVKKIKQQEGASNQRVDEIKLIIDDWKKEGYSISELEGVLSEPLEVIETKFIDVADKIQNAMDLFEEFEAFQKAKGDALALIENHLEPFKTDIKDIAKTDELKGKFMSLREFVDKNKGLEELKKQMDELGGKGIDVADIKKTFEGSLSSIIVDDIKKKLDDLQSNIGKRSDVLDYLHGLGDMIGEELMDDSEVQGKKEELLKLQGDAEDASTLGKIYDKFTTLKGELEKMIQDKQTQISAKKELKDKKFSAWDGDIKTWERENYKIFKLKEAMEANAPMDEIEGIYNDYKQKIDTLRFQNGIFTKLLTPENLNDFKDEIETIKTDVLDPEKTDEVTQKIIKLQYSVKQKEKEREGAAKEGERRDYIQRMLDGYKKEGYVLEKLEEAMDKDLDTLESVFNDVKNRIQRIDNIKVELSKIDIRGLESVAAPIFDLFKDPYQLDQIEQLVKRLKETVEKKNIRRDEIRSVISKWKEQGFDTTAIENALSNDIETLEVRFNEFTEKIEKLTNLKKELETLNTEGFEKKVRVIQDKMGNPENLESVTEDMDFLKREIEKKNAEAGAVEQAKVDEYIKSVQEWKDAGFQVDDLLATVQGGSIDQSVIDEVEITRIKVGRAERLKEGLQSIKQDWIKEDVDLIRDNLTDLMIIDELEKGYQEIHEKLEDYNQSIGSYQTKINAFKEEGYITTRLENLQGKDDGEIEQEFMKFGGDIKLLNQLREALVNLQNRQHPGEYDEVFTELFIKLADPDRITEIGQNLQELEKQLDELDAAADEPVEQLIDVTPEEVSKQVEELAADQPKSKVKKKKSKKKKSKKKSKEELLQELRAEAKAAQKDKEFENALEIWDEILELDPGNKEAGFMKKRAESMLKAAGHSKKKKKSKKKAKKVAEEEEEEEAAEPAKAEAAAEDGGGGTGSCTSCGGKGTCYWCNGSGKCDSCGGSGKNLMENDCVSCKGTGKCANCDGSTKCYWCGGSGNA